MTTGLLALAELIRTVQVLAEDLDALTGELLRQEGLTRAQRRILTTLRKEGPQTMAGLSRRLGVSRQNVRSLVLPLLKLGLLDQAANPDHRRAPLVGVAPAGVEAVKRILGREGEVLGELERGMSGPEVRACTETLGAFRKLVASARPAGR